MDPKRKVEEALEPTTNKSVKGFGSAEPEFRELLESVGVSYPHWRNPLPSDFEQLQDYLSKGWPGLEKEVTDQMCDKFVDRNSDAPAEATVDESVRETLGPDGFDAGSVLEGPSSARNLRYVCMKSLRIEFSNPQPNFQEGTQKGLLDVSIRQRLRQHIDLSRHAKAPCIPNFFME